MRLNPAMESALRAMTCGPLQWTETGWTSTAGIAGCWNNHTIGWMAHQRLVGTYQDNERGGVRRAKIKSAGKRPLSELECAA